MRLEVPEYGKVDSLDEIKALNRKDARTVLFLFFKEEFFRPFGTNNGRGEPWRYVWTENPKVLADLRAERPDIGEDVTALSFFARRNTVADWTSVSPPWGDVIGDLLDKGLD